jgi:methyl-accepting chemotaxis protein
MKKTIKKFGIGKKLTLIVIVSIILVVFVTVGFSILEFTQLMKENAKTQAENGVAGLKEQIDMETDNAKKIAVLLASNPLIIDAVEQQDRAALESVMNAISETISIDFVTFSDEFGTVIYRAHEPEKYGDSVISQENVARALSGEVAALVERGTAVPLSTRAGCPVYNNAGEIVGVVSTGTRLDNNDLLDKCKKTLQTDLTIFLDNIRIATTIEKNGERVVGTELDPVIANIVINQKSTYSGDAKILGKDYITFYSPLFASDGSVLGVLFAGQSMTQFYLELSNIIWLVVVISAAAILLIVLNSSLIVRRILTRPVQNTAGMANALAAGEVDQTIQIRSNDEIGELAHLLDTNVRQAFKKIEQARAVSEKQARYQSEQVSKLLYNLKRLAKGVLYCDMDVSPADEDTREIHALFSEISENLHSSIDAINGYIRDITYFLDKLASGDISEVVESEYQGDFAVFKNSINKIIENMNSLLSEIAIAADQVASGTAQVASGSQTISQGATEQASAIEHLTASIAEIAAQTRQTALNANDSNRLSLDANTAAITGSEQMVNLQKAMADINESSDNISKIIKVIDDIAFQTNILALNAAVEAARAGVHGKGFAVVAEEVRNLATRSATAAKETTSLIEGSIRSVESGTEIANAMAVAFEKIVAGSNQSVTLSSAIATAANEQAAGISQVNTGIEQMSQVVQTNSASAEQTAAASQQLSSQAQMLKQMIAKFKLKEDNAFRR